MKHKRQTNYANFFKVKNKTKWTPKETHYTLKTFIDLIQHEINGIKTKKVKISKSKLSNGEQEAMKHLAKLKDINISTADKGGTVVIMDTENYIKEVNAQLSDKINYKMLQKDPTLKHNEKVNDTLYRFQNENPLFKKTAEGLKIINSKAPKLYTTPKIHRENNPGRPVIKPINYHTSEIPRF